ncbi:hypothetical protein [Dipodfec virus UOA04_Rod_1087]|nr:hypothetical protein [Dipodfec virus UOA04_Rod_1087]
MDFQQFLDSAVSSPGEEVFPLPFHVTIFGRGFEKATQSITIPGTSTLEIDLSKFAPMCNYKLQIVPLCPMEDAPDAPADAVSGSDA